MKKHDKKIKDHSKRIKLKIKPVITASLFILLTTWILSDLFGPSHNNLRKFNPEVIAGLETDMWHAYYDKDSFHLYRLLVYMLHDQQGFPLLRANYEAYLAAKAAVVFKEGNNRHDYELALPYLIKYYKEMKNIGELKCNPVSAAKAELEWWIIHRERMKYGTEALVKAVAQAAGVLYGEDTYELMDYAKARTEAMIIRDEGAEKKSVSQNEWQQINNKLLYSYNALYKVLNQNSVIN
jgi:hypothetical protein